VKKVILCEGKRDNLFVEGLFNRLKIPEYNRKIFDHKENHAFSDIKHRETNFLRSFYENSSPYKIVSKSEAGKEKVLRIYPEFFESLANNVGATFLMVDLGGGELNSFISQLEEKIIGFLGRKIDVKTEVIESNQYIIASKSFVSMRKDSKHIGEFYTLAFKSSLEDVAGIDDNEDSAIKEKKIKRLLENRSIVDPFCSAMGSD